ncbi:MAG: hypothetical protein ACEQSR_08360 [Candidatus Methylacidiphilales bacterium]
MKPILILIFIFTIASCCDDSKTCLDAKVSDFRSLPYNQFNTLQFKDSIGRSIYVLFNNPIITSKGQSYKGSCAAMKNSNNCEKSIGLNSSRILDSNNMINSSFKNFEFSASINDVFVQTININAFGNSAQYSFGNKDEVIKSVYNYDKQIQFVTPYKTYSNVFISKNNRFQSKLFIDNTGRLVSFALNTDTLNLFNLVE